MISSRRIVDVAGQQAALLPERFPGYREEIVRCLVAIVAAQNEGLSDRGRREQVSKALDAFGSKLASKLTASD